MDPLNRGTEEASGSESHSMNSFRRRIPLGREPEELQRVPRILAAWRLRSAEMHWRARATADASWFLERRRRVGVHSRRGAAGVMRVLWVCQCKPEEGEGGR